MKRAASLLGWLLLGWVLCWLSLGLLAGEPLLLLRPGSPENMRVAYLVGLYFWLLGATAYCWRGQGPRWVRWGGPADFLGGFALGAAFLALHRGILGGLGWWQPAQPFPWAILGLALLTSPLLAWAEEWVFRGYLYGVLREEWGKLPAALSVNLFFAGVHLFRPGGLEFKLALGFGLFVVGLVLTLALERRGRLLAGIGLHASLVVAGIVDPPAQTVPGLWAGLRGEAPAGLLGWLLLLMLGLLLQWTKVPRNPAPNGEKYIENRS